MWSGPRTVSTALMRAWENRPDTKVTDEPLYAFYLFRTALAHPGRDHVIASQPTDWRVVLAEQTSAPLPPGVRISYAKHMTHHLLPWMDRAWLGRVANVFLLREPREVLPVQRARLRHPPSEAPRVVARLRRVPGALTEASMDLGADGWQTFRYVTLPVISTALVAGALLAFALSFDEVVVTTFTAGAQNTLPLWIFGNIRLGQQLPQVNVVVLLVLVITVIPITLAQRLTRDTGVVRGTAGPAPGPAVIATAP